MALNKLRGKEKRLKMVKNSFKEYTLRLVKI
jgi:hypothetical protein